LPFGDADLWEEHGLPVAIDDAYPVAVQFKPDGRPRRPDAGTISYLEGLLVALAESTESEMDQGPNDNQGVRYSLLTALLASGLNYEAGVRFEQFRGESTALWL
jgi:hypothetical protein